MILVLLLALGSGDTQEPTKVEKPTTVDKSTAVDKPEVVKEPEVVEEVKQQEFLVGETVKMGELEFTVNSVRYDNGSEFLGPDEGTKWLVIDCTLKNIGQESEALSSMLMFTLYDSEFYSKEMAIFAETKGSLNGELGAGRTMRGEVAFVVDAAETEWELIFEPNTFGFGQAIYKITAEDIK